MATMPADRRGARGLELIAGLSTASAGGLDPSTRLADIGFDSLAFVDLAAAVEEELGLDLGGAFLDEGSTVGDVLAAFEKGAASGGEVRVPSSLGRIQRLADLLGGGFLRWWFHLEVRGADRVPAHGAVILAMNHESALDIPIAVVASPRPIRFMAKSDLFRGRVVGRALHELGGFEVDRDRFDLRAVRLALEVLARGEVLGMFAEGTRAPGRLLPFMRGAAWAALRTGAPIVPVGIRGTQHARPLTRAPVRVAFGESVEVQPLGEAAERRDGSVALTNRLRDVVETLIA